MNVKERIIRMIQSAGDKPLLRRKLIRTFDISRRAVAEKEISNLIGAGYLNPIGLGRRGSPAMVIVSPTWPFNKCPMCAQQVNQKSFGGE